MIDGQDIRDIRIRSLRDQISIVLQDPILFSGMSYGSINLRIHQGLARAANFMGAIVHFAHHEYFT